MQILVSIGLNPLPVLIAVRRLAQLHPGATFRFLLSRDEELDGILDLLKNVKVGISHKLIPLGDPKSPREIMEKIQKSFAGETGPIHFHFTGGTKAMVLYAARALAKSDERFTTSYISAEAHTLIGSNLMSGEDVVLGILDERTDLLLDFEQIARLHGHTMHYRVQTRFGQYEVGDGPRKNNFLPSRRADKPAPAWFEAATAMAACHLRLASNDRDNWKSFLDGIRQVLGPNRSFWLLPSPPRASAVRWPLADKGVLTLMNEAAGKEVWDRSGGFQPGGLSPDEFEDVCNFLLSRWLEIYVHGVLHAQLQTVGLPFHCAEGLRFARLDLAENGSQRPAKKDFELDVAAMLGYQLMVVSCYAGWNAKEVKMKGFEAIHRARQIGGSEAPAVMVSLAYEQEAEEVELELDAQARTFGVPIRVWHRRDLPRLDVEFDRLLGELAWKK